MVRRSASLLLVLLLGACGAKQHPAPATAIAVAAPDPGWRGLVAPADRARLDALPGALSGMRARLPVASRRLADPGAALDHPELSPGSYRCRAAQVRAPDFCYVSATPDGLALVKQTGARAFAGYLHRDGQRYVLVGATQRRAGENSIGYGADPTRDAIGTVERIGSFRWRLAVTGAGTAAPLLYELTPLPADAQPDAS